MIRERHRAVHIKRCVACQQCKLMFSFLTLNLYEKKWEKSYEMIFFNYKMTGGIIRKHVMISVCDEVKLQKFFTSLSAIVHVEKYVKL